MAEDARSIQELLSTAFAQVGRLLRTELELAKAEVSTSIGNAAVGLGLLGAAFLVGTAALVVLLLAISAWFVQFGLTETGARFLAAALAVAVSLGLAWAGLRRLRANALTPRR